MSAKDTSRKAYRELLESGAMSRQQWEVLATLGSRHLTRSEIADKSGMRLSAVCGRVHDLVGAGLIEVVGQGPCPLTGRTAERLSVSNRGRMAIKAKEAKEVAA